MATTRIWSISGWLDYVINYMQNPEKTDGAKYTSSELQALQDVIDYTENPSKTEERLYVTEINVSPDIARDQMVMTKLQYGKMDKILAYHGYQSFLPGEVTPDLAHELCVELTNLDRYQKQFRFLYDNNIETAEQLQAFKTTAESKVEELTIERSGLYNKPEANPDIAEINSKLRELRKEIRLCNNIFEDSERIKERYEAAMQLEQEEKEQRKPHRRFIDKER